MDHWPQGKYFNNELHPKQIYWLRSLTKISTAFKFCHWPNISTDFISSIQQRQFSYGFKSPEFRKWEVLWAVGCCQIFFVTDLPELRVKMFTNELEWRFKKLSPKFIFSIFKILLISCRKQNIYLCVSVDCRGHSFL